MGYEIADNIYIYKWFTWLILWKHDLKNHTNLKIKLIANRSRSYENNSNGRFRWLWTSSSGVLPFEVNIYWNLKRKVLNSYLNLYQLTNNHSEIIRMCFSQNLIIKSFLPDLNITTFSLLIHIKIETNFYTTYRFKTKIHANRKYLI